MRPAAQTRAVTLLLISFVSAAVCLWLLPASVHIVGWEDTRPVRVVQLQPPGWLVLWLVVAVVAALGVHRASGPLATDTASRIAAPLTLLALWLLPYLPWLPERLPLLLVLAGPLRWVVATAALTGCLVIGARERWRLDVFTRLPGRRAVLIATVVLLGSAGAYVKGIQGVTGDEPHYLVIAHSLVADGDLQIENNHAQGDYREFYFGALPPQYIRRGVNENIYSVHAPGLPVLLAPGYAVGGQWGAMALVVLMASLTGFAIFNLAERLTTRPVAWVTWAAVSLTVPFAPHGWLIFPEVPAGLIMAWVALWLFTPVPARASSWIWRGLALGVLPWLHMKYAVLLAVAALCALMRLWPRVRQTVAFLAPLLVSCVLWLVSFQVMYGTPNPTVVYGYGAGASLAVSHVPRGVLGLLFDQEFGVLLYSPVYLLASVGLWTMLRRPEWRWPIMGLTGLAAALTLSVTPYYMWWGGDSAPARFLVPAVPLVAPLMAMGFDRCRTAAARGTAAMLLMASVGVFATLLYDPGLRLQFNDRDGTGRLVEHWQSGVDLTSVLPTFIPSDWFAPLGLVLAWGTAGVAAGLVALAVGRRHRTMPRAFWSGALGLVAFGLCASLLWGQGLSAPARDAFARRGQQAAIAAYDGGRLSRWRYPSAQHLSDTEWREHVTLTQRTFDLRWRELGQTRRTQGRVAGPFGLAAGRYLVRVWLDPTVRFGSDEEIWVTFRRGPGLLGRRAAGGVNPVEVPLDLPVTLDPVWIGATSPVVSDAVRKVEIQPEQTIPRHRRDAFGTIRQAENIGGVPGRYVIHLDDNIFVEPRGFWVAGTAVARFHVTSGGAKSFTMTLRNGPRPGPLTVRIDGQDQVIDLGPNQERRLRISLPGGARSVSLTVAPPGGFRPVDHAPDSTDSRWLGCWVEISFDRGTEPAAPAR